MIVFHLTWYDSVSPDLTHITDLHYSLASHVQGDPHKLEDVQNYLVGMFNHVRHDTTLELYRHFTTATNTRNIKVVFNIVKDTILTRHIQDIMQL